MPGRCLRGFVIDVKLDPVVGSEQGKTRPCVVIQNDIGNKYSPVTIVAVITSADNVPKLYPSNVFIPRGCGGLEKDSVVLCNQVRTVDESRLGKVHGQFTTENMNKIDSALKISLGLR